MARYSRKAVIRVKKATRRSTRIEIVKIYSFPYPVIEIRTEVATLHI